MDSKVRIPVVLKDSVEIVPHVAEVIVRGKIIDTETATNDNKHAYIFCPNDLTLQHVILAHELVTSKRIKIFFYNRFQSGLLSSSNEQK